METTRTPRRMAVDEPDVGKKRPAYTQTPPNKQSTSWKLWTECLDIAGEALATKYIQGIAHGKLDPNHYGQYSVQDCGYCYHAAGCYKKLVTRAESMNLGEIAKFAQARHESYVRYNATLRKTWRISPNPDALEFSEAVESYINLEDIVCSLLPPIYGIILMIPCEQLWPFLATELEKYDKPANLYRFWITDNSDWHGAYRLDDFVDRWIKEHPEEFDFDTAKIVYRSAMLSELNFFRSACKESLKTPLPIADHPKAKEHAKAKEDAKTKA